MSWLSGSKIILRALSNRNYRIYTAGSAVSLTGTWMQRVATGWLAWELTGSGAWLGLIAFADLFPTVLIGLIAGAAADRWDRLWITRFSQGLGLSQATALAILTISGHMTIELLFALTACMGTIAAFNQPARLALIPSMVPREDLGAAVAINAVVFNMARFVGPAVAGLLIVVAGTGAAFAVNAVTFAIFLAALMTIRMPPMDAPKGERGSFLGEVAAGVRYSATHPGIAAILILMLASGIGARPVVELLPGFAADVFNAGAPALAMLTSAVGFGAIVGGLWLGGRASQVGLTRLVLASSFMLGLMTILFAASQQLWLAVPTMAIAGFCMVFSGIGSQTLVQMAVAGNMRGRVLSLYGQIFRGAPALGALAMGFASERLGLQWPVALGAGILLLVCFWARRRVQRIAASLES